MESCMWMALEVSSPLKNLLADQRGSGFLGLFRRQVLPPGDHLHIDGIGQERHPRAELAEA